MTGKSKGTGLLDDSGKVVREIKATKSLVDLFTPGSHVSQGDVIDKAYAYTNYQNDGMGCQTENIEVLENIRVRCLDCGAHFYKAKGDNFYGNCWQCGSRKNQPAEKVKAPKLKRVK